MNYSLTDEEICQEINFTLQNQNEKCQETEFKYEVTQTIHNEHKQQIVKTQCCSDKEDEEIDALINNVCQKKGCLNDEIDFHHKVKIIQDINSAKKNKKFVNECFCPNQNNEESFLDLKEKSSKVILDGEVDQTPQGNQSQQKQTNSVSRVSFITIVILMVLF